MLRCDEVMRLCSSEAVRSAPLSKRVAVRMHLLLCRHCRRYVRELARIGEAVRALVEPSIEERDRNERLTRRILGEPTEPPG